MVKEIHDELCGQQGQRVMSECERLVVSNPTGSTRLSTHWSSIARRPLVAMSYAEPRRNRRALTMTLSIEGKQLQSTPKHQAPASSKARLIQTPSIALRMYHNSPPLETIFNRPKSNATGQTNSLSCRLSQYKSRQISTGTPSRERRIRVRRRHCRDGLRGRRFGDLR